MRYSLVTSALILVLTNSVASAQAPRETSFEQIEKGRYLAVLGDCKACHTVPGGKPFAGGVPLETPFGVILGANITPDMETGIGKMTLEQFQKTMSEGIGRSGYHLYPAMPFPAYTKVTAEDNAAIYAYLQSLQPVKNEVETNQLPFPFSIRASLMVWNAINFTKGEFQPDAAKSEEWNRGAYIVDGLGHCGTCHTPKNMLGGEKNDLFLQGSVLGSWYAPNITGNAHKGIGSWKEEDIVEYLKTGTNRFDTASGPMAEAVVNSTQYFTDADLKAVATYLKDVGDIDAKPPAPMVETDKRMVVGKAIYEDRCSACHMPNGEGVAKLFPKLASAPLINADDPISLIKVVLEGSRGEGTTLAPTGPAMPSLAWNLNDDDVANVLTYVRNSWGNAAAPVTADAVAKLRESATQ